VIIIDELEEKRALDIETELIAYWGRRDLGTGILCNLTDGGEGVSGWIPTDENKKNMSVKK
jgi:hypothetical protein